MNFENRTPHRTAPQIILKYGALHRTAPQALSKIAHRTAPQPKFTAPHRSSHRTANIPATNKISNFLPKFSVENRLKKAFYLMSKVSVFMGD